MVIPMKCYFFKPLKECVSFGQCISQGQFFGMIFKTKKVNLYTGNTVCILTFNIITFFIDCEMES